MRISLLLFTLLMIPALLSAELTLTWDENFGGIGEEGATVVRACSDGGMIVAGRESGSDGGDDDILVFKLNSAGTVEWEKSFGGDYTDEINDIVEFGGEFILAGSTVRKPGGRSLTGEDIWLLRLSADGDLLEEEILTAFGDQCATTIRAGDFGELWLLGHSFLSGNYDVIIKKLSLTASGIDDDPLWEESFGSTEDEYGDELILLEGGGYFFASSVHEPESGDFDAWVVYDGQDAFWEQAFGSSYGFSCEAAIACEGGGFLLVGDSWLYDGDDRDVWLCRLDGDGNVIWGNAYDEGPIDGGNAVIETPDGGFIVAAVTIDRGDTDWWVFKVNSDGYMLWNKTFGEDGYDFLSSLDRVGDDEYVLAGESESFSESGDGDSDMLVVKFKDK